MTACFDDIEPIFRFLCECTMYKPDDANFLWSLMRASCVILDTPSIGDELMNFARQHLAIPEEMIELRQKSQEYLMAVTWRFIESCEHLANDVERERISVMVDRVAATSERRVMPPQA